MKHFNSQIISKLIGGGRSPLPMLIFAALPTFCACNDEEPQPTQPQQPTQMEVTLADTVWEETVIQYQNRHSTACWPTDSSSTTRP